ncbi:MAG: GlsB/YeaQ/YmgE family stress response membrane protein [Gammaproteobacteria bacterium]
MTIGSLIIFLIVGALAGWLAGLIVRGSGFGILGNIVVGVVGAFLAGWLLPKVGLYIGGGFVAALINALIGAIILLFVIGILRQVWKKS